MKGAVSGEFLGKILISVFMVGVVIILLATFLPEFVNQDCKNKQVQSINSIVNDAIAARASKTIKNFVVQSCVEYVEFDILCKQQVPQAKSLQIEDKSCYEVLLVGQNEGNCKDFGELDCNAHKGTLGTFPGKRGLFEISPESQLKKLTPGTYTAEIEPYSINFVPKQ